MKLGYIVAAFFGLIWCSGTFLLDAYLGYKCLLQLQAQRYSQVSGKIVQSEVTHRVINDSKGRPITVNGIGLTYTYTVANKEYKGNRYRYQQGESSDSGARQVVNNYPVGASIPVYYNPLDPNDALLDVGINGEDLFLLFFMAPFSLMAFWFLSLPFKLLAQSRFKSTGGLKTFKQGRLTLLRLYTQRPIDDALLLGFLISLILLVYVAIGDGFHPSLLKAEVVWVILIVAVVLIYLRSLSWILTNRYCLVIDETQQRLVIPTNWIQPKAEVKFSEVANIEVKQLFDTDSEGNKNNKYMPTISWWDSNQNIKERKLIVWHEKECAENLADWLRQKCRLS